MSNEIKPVAWVRVGMVDTVTREVKFLVKCGSAKEHTEDQPLYDQSAIDRLTAERDTAVCDHCVDEEHLAILRRKNAELEAQLAEYKADAERWRICRDPKNPTYGESQTIIWLEGLGNAWGASEWLTGEFADEAADAAIDAARKGVE